MIPASMPGMRHNSESTVQIEMQQRLHNLDPGFKLFGARHTLPRRDDGSDLKFHNSIVTSVLF